MSCPINSSIDSVCHYGDYLKLETLLSCQVPRTSTHDEMLFITIHQSYELWFKQILHEIDSCISLFSKDPQELPEKQLLVIVSRLKRITEIWKVLNSQLHVLETMYPGEFLLFRDHLAPASGFQSVQFKLIENRLGLEKYQRLQYNNQSYTSQLNEKEERILTESEFSSSLFAKVEQWLERTPVMDFWNILQSTIRNNFSPEICTSVFSPIFDRQIYETAKQQKRCRLSYSAFQSALCIFLLKDQPLFQMPFQLLTHLLDIDELMTAWRNAHANMVHRMLGMKVGTGGSSGYKYLKATATQHKIFTDFFNLSQYLIPSNLLPELPLAMKRKYHFSE